MEKVKKEVKEVIETYVVPKNKASFDVKVLEDGKEILKTHPDTGAPIRFNGRKQYEEETISFSNVISNFRKGCLCQYLVYEDTPKHIVKRLKELAKDRSSGVLTHDQWLEKYNPAAFEELIRREEAEKLAKEAFEKGKAEGSDPKVAEDLEKAKSENIQLWADNENMLAKQEEDKSIIEKLQAEAAKIEKDAKS